MSLPIDARDIEDRPVDLMILRFLMDDDLDDDDAERFLREVPPPSALETIAFLSIVNRLRIFLFIAFVDDNQFQNYSSYIQIVM